MQGFRSAEDLAAKYRVAYSGDTVGPETDCAMRKLAYEYVESHSACPLAPLVRAHHPRFGQRIQPERLVGRRLRDLYVRSATSLPQGVDRVV